MKNFLITIILTAFIIADSSAIRAANPKKSLIIALQQTDTLRHKTYKRHKKVVRKTSTQKAARRQKQLKQADKHLRDEKKVQKVQQELKKDTLHQN